MKKYTLKSLLFVLLCIFSAASLSAAKPFTIGLDVFQKDNERIMAQAPDSSRVVFFGNSITECWIQHRPSFFSEHGYIDRGISGQDTYQLLARFRADVVDLHPAVVVLSGGTNDVAENNFPYNEDRTFGNIVSMIEIAQANGIHPVLGSALPAAGFKWNRAITDAPDKLMSLNARLARYAAEKGIPFIDYYSALASPDGRSMADGLSLDGVHPLAAGYIIMENLVQPEIIRARR